MILSCNVRDNVASLLGSAGHRSAGHRGLASWTSLCEYIVIAPNVVDAVHGTTCRMEDVPFCRVSGSQIGGPSCLDCQVHIASNGERVPDQQASLMCFSSVYSLKVRDAWCVACYFPEWSVPKYPRRARATATGPAGRL